MRRRDLLTTAALAAALPRRSIAQEEPIILDWDHLLPEDFDIEAAYEALMAGVSHDRIWTPDRSESDEEVAARILSGVVTRYDGKRVRLPGYVIPLALDGVTTKELLLTPFVGACIHVPPPPPNQIVYVVLDEPYEFDALWEPIWVTGRMRSAALRSRLADIGYRIEGEFVEPYLF